VPTVYTALTKKLLGYCASASIWIHVTSNIYRKAPLHPRKRPSHGLGAARGDNGPERDRTLRATQPANRRKYMGHVDCPRF
jgi:hypothetical protein